MDNKLMLQFADQMIKKSGLNLCGDFLAEYRKNLLEKLEKEVWLMIENELKDDKMIEFDKITESIKDDGDIDANKRDEIMAFCQKNISDFEAKVLKTMNEFVDNFTKDVKKIIL